MAEKEKDGAKRAQEPPTFGGLMEEMFCKRVIEAVGKWQEAGMPVKR